MVRISINKQSNHDTALLLTASTIVGAAKQVDSGKGTTSSGERAARAQPTATVASPVMSPAVIAATSPTVVTKHHDPVSKEAVPTAATIVASDAQTRDASPASSTTSVATTVAQVEDQVEELEATQVEEPEAMTSAALIEKLTKMKESLEASTEGKTPLEIPQGSPPEEGRSIFDSLTVPTAPVPGMVFGPTATIDSFVFSVPTSRHSDTNESAEKTNSLSLPDEDQTERKVLTVCSEDNVEPAIALVTSGTVSRNPRVAETTFSQEPLHVVTADDAQPSTPPARTTVSEVLLGDCRTRLHHETAVAPQTDFPFLTRRAVPYIAGGQPKISRFRPHRVARHNKALRERICGRYDGPPHWWIEKTSELVQKVDSGLDRMQSNALLRSIVGSLKHMSIDDILKHQGDNEIGARLTADE